jgi:hypothetical protein
VCPLRPEFHNLLALSLLYLFSNVVTQQASCRTRLVELCTDTLSLHSVPGHNFSQLCTGLLTIKLVSSTGEQASGILIAAAAPVTLLTALSKSSLGKQVQEGLNEKLPQLEADAAALKQQHAGG